MERLLPRHMQIIYLINALHLDALRAKGVDDPRKLAAVSLIDEHHGRHVRMGPLAFLGSHKVNGVSALHSELVKETVFRDLHDIFPERICNKTNGVTFRRWLFEANPQLTKLLVETLGKEVLDDPSVLKKLEPYADDLNFQARWAAAKQANKENLARIIADRMLIKVNPNALFDVQIKRIHEYKRQLLNILDTIALYNEIRAQPMRDVAPRVKIFAGKAAASYHQAKLIIKLANDVARVVNNDPTVRDQLKVVFLPNYNVSLAEVIIPAADLSEQISTAGMEASGTGNMKMALNGALTIGTLDGANVEIKERVGDDNIFIFGLKADEVAARRARGIDMRETIDGLARVARGAGKHRRRRLLARRPPPLPGAGRFPDLPRLFPGVRRLRRLSRRAERRGAALARPQVLAARRHSQHGAHRLVLLGPHHRGICRRNLERSGEQAEGLTDMSKTPKRAQGAEKSARTQSAKDHRVHKDEIAALANGSHGNPFAVLGPHAVPGGTSIRALVPGAKNVTALIEGGETIALSSRGKDFFEGVTDRHSPFAYRLRAENSAGAWEWDDPYRFGPLLGPLDDHLLVEGAHLQLYERLGAHALTHEGVDGRAFLRLGAAGPARFRGRRLQPMGRPPPRHAQAHRFRPVGDFRSRTRARRRSTNTKFSARQGTSCR